jgi:hypothetical protein
MDEISKYDIELFLNNNNLLLIDAYINKDNELILETENPYSDASIDEDMFIAEMELNFSQFSNITYDSEFENFLILFHDKDTKLVD